MSFDTIRRSRFLITFLRFAGLWPNDGPDMHRLVARYWRCYQFLLQATLTFLVTTLMWLEICWAEDLDTATQVLCFALTESALVLKIFNIWWNGTRAVQLLRDWETNEIYKLQTPEEHHMWQETHRKFNTISLVYRGVSANTALIAFIAALFMERKHLPFSYWVPRQWRETYFWYTFLYDIIALTFTCLCNTHLDMFNCYMLVHLSTCFRVIGMRLERLGEDGLNVKFTTEFVNIMKLHQRVKRTTKECESIISIPMLVQIMLTSFVLCFTIYRLQSLNVLNDSNAIVVVVQYALAMILQIFLPCYYANEVTISARQLSDQIYNSNWINMSQKNRRLVLLSIMYLKQPLVLKAGRFFELGLPIFSKTINNAYNLLAVLLQVSDDI